MKKTLGFTLFKISIAVIFFLTSTGQASAAQQRGPPSQNQIYEAPTYRTEEILRYQMQQESVLLFLNRFQFDPLLGEPELPPEQQTVFAPGEEGFHLVQFIGPPEDQWLDELRAAGVVIIQGQPSHAYIVRMTPEEAAFVDEQDFVRWVGVYHAAYRIAPSVLKPPVVPIPLRQHVIRNVDVTIYNTGQVLETIAAIQQMGGELIEQFPVRSDESLVTAIFALPFDVVVDVAQLNSVLWMNFRPPVDEPEDEMSNQIIAGNSNPLGPGYQAWLTANGVNGTGVAVALVDSGYDTGNNATAHPDLQGRLIPVGTPIDTNGHGTHVGGIIAGNATLGTTDATGYLFGSGVAPNANLVAITATGADTARTRNAVTNGALASNHSYSLQGGSSGYTSRDALHDSLVRDADQTTANVAEPIIIVFSAGNCGNPASLPPNCQGSIGPTKEAKNVIAVGNSLSQRTGAGVPVPGIGNIDTLSGSSSRGPAQDNRIYPHVTAPGTNIVSTRSTQVAIPAPFLSSCAAIPTGAPFAHPTYAMCSGTSMAAPHVTGGVALITQWWRTFNAGANPSPAMAKALLINRAVDMGVADIPNNNEGWGRINLNTVINPPVPVIYHDQTRIFGMNNETFTLQASPADPTQPLKITLVWTDAPGPGSGGTTRGLMNNLDLSVAEGTNTYLGNVFASGWSVTGGVADDINNVENVYIQNPGGGYDITVTAIEFLGDGVPYNADLTDQDFALVCYNCAVPADLSITKSDAPDPVTPGSTLTYSLTVTNNGPGDATDVIVTDTLPPRVTYDPLSSSPGCTETVAGIVTCDLGVLANGASAAVTIVVAVDPAIACGTTLPNIAEVMGNEPDTNLPNTASADTTISCPLGLDIRPEAFPNRIRLDGPRLVHVAILSIASIDATNKVDRTSLTFGHSGNEDSLHRQGRDCWRNDVNNDGLLDLVCNFVIRRTGFQPSDTVGILKGMLLDGTSFEAQDSVVILP